MDGVGPSAVSQGLAGDAHLHAGQRGAHGACGGEQGNHTIRDAKQHLLIYQWRLQAVLALKNFLEGSVPSGRRRSHCVSVWKCQDAVLFTELGMPLNTNSSPEQSPGHSLRTSELRNEAVSFFFF